MAGKKVDQISNINFQKFANAHQMCVGTTLALPGGVDKKNITNYLLSMIFSTARTPFISRMESHTLFRDAHNS